MLIIHLCRCRGHTRTREICFRFEAKGEERHAIEGKSPPRVMISLIMYPGERLVERNGGGPDI